MGLLGLLCVNRDNLLKPGTHQATGHHWDIIDDKLTVSGNFVLINYLESVEMEIVLENVNVNNGIISGEGYINIKQQIGKFPPQVIYFKTEG